MSHNISRKLYNQPKPGVSTRFLQRAGCFQSRNLHWSWYSPRNFGDWLGPYLFKKITGRNPVYTPSRKGSRVKYFLTVGSVLRRIRESNTAIVWGSGIISKADSFERPRQITAVRGPYSRRRCLELGYDCPESFGDPAILLPRYYSPVRQEEPKARLGIIPHFVEFEIARELFINHKDIKIISVADDIESVINNISNCDACVSSSLHGVIVAHSYGVPCGPVSFSDKLHGDGTKFLDYYSSAGIAEQTALKLSRHSIDPLELIDFAMSCELPNLTYLRQQLAASCPFPDNNHDAL